MVTRNQPERNPQKDWYVTAMGHLVEVVQKLSLARDMPSLMAIVRKAARELTGADGATFVLRDQDLCYYAEENAISPLWKGQRFPIQTCISGWVMLNAKPAVIKDIYADPRIPAAAYRPTFVKSLAMVPIRENAPIGAIGNYWANHREPSPEELSILQALANVTSVTMENIGLYDTLQEKLIALKESNDELSRFAWIAAHDLKSPMRGIDNLSQWIAEDTGNNLTPESQTHLQKLHLRVRRMETLLDDILEYSHVERTLVNSDSGAHITGKVMLQEIQDALSPPPAFTLQSDACFKKALLPSIPLQQVFYHLIGNAIKHHDKPSGLIEISCEETDTTTVFKVKDNGPGIAIQYQEQIFEMFKTLKPRDEKEGSGIGLALVRKILALYGSDIHIESEQGKGACFYFAWPKQAHIRKK